MPVCYCVARIGILTYMPQQSGKYKFVATRRAALHE
jgi:hypothetical protein